jgi:hypothetical protein
MKLIAVVEAYQTLVAIKNSNDMPIGLAWQILDQITEMAPTNERFEKQKNALGEKYGDPDPENPGMVHIRKKEEEKFQKDFDDLSNIEIPMNGIKKLSKAELLKTELKVPAGTNLGSLKPLIEN